VVHVRLTGRRRALAGFAAGCALIVAGMWVWLGAAGGLITAGALLAISFLTLADVEEVKRAQPPAVGPTLNDPTL